VAPCVVYYSELPIKNFQDYFAFRHDSLCCLPQGVATQIYSLEREEERARQCRRRGTGNVRRRRLDSAGIALRRTGNRRRRRYRRRRERQRGEERSRQCIYCITRCRQ